MLNRRRLSRGAGALLTMAAVAVMVRVAVVDAASIRSFRWTLRPGLLLAGTAMEVALLMGGVWLWWMVLARFDGPRTRYRAVLRVWCGTTLAKYLPGSVWPLVTAAAMAPRIGASPVALPASFLLHATFTVLGAAAVAGAFAGWGAHGAVALLAAPLAALLVHPVVLNRLVRLAARVARRDAPEWRGGWADGAGLLALYAAIWVGYGVSFWLFVSSIAPVSRATWTLLAGANALAFVAGFVAVFSPGGVGVGDAALAMLLLPFFPRGVPVLIAAAARLWAVAAELVGGALVLSVGAAGSRVARDRPVPARAAVPGVTHGNHLEVLTDTAAALGQIAAACREARSSVWIAQLAFDADCVCSKGVNGEPDELLVDALVAAARGGAEVRVLLNGSILMNTGPALRRAFTAARVDPARVSVRGVDAFPQIMHAKLVVIDGADAFLVGSPFVNGYWDDGAHRAADATRNGGDLAGRPIHDVSVRVAGPAVRTLAEWFAEVWNGASFGPPLTLAPPVEEAPRRGGSSLRVVRTLPAGVLAGRPEGATEILDAYLDGIASARTLIYLEHQYFSARPIREALSAALAARPRLEVVLLVNQNPDITAYRGWQNRRLDEGGLLEHPRVGVFSLWAAARASTLEVTQLFIHGKTALIDDRWAALGTANLDGVSLHSYGDDFSGILGRTIFRGCRNFDLDLVMLDGGGTASLRRRLWSRHLGIAAHELEERPAGGWLPVWRAAAAANVRRLTRGEMPRGHVLPYTPAPRPRAQLRALGIDPEAARLDLRFDPGWVEVHWSPGWLRQVIPEPIRDRFTGTKREPGS